MKKLIVSLATLGTGGAERVLSVLSSHLADCFDEVQYVMWEGGEIFYSIDQRIKIVSLPSISGHKGRLRQIWSFRKYIKKENPDLILSFLTPYNMLVLLSTMGLNKRIIVAERTDPKRLLSGGRLMLRVRDVLYHRAYGILTQTQYAKDCYDTKFKGKTKVLSNPITMGSDYVGKALSTQKERLFVTAGRLEAVKDQAMLVKAFALFHKSHQDYRLIIYGEGPLLGALQDTIQKAELENAVTLAGRTNQLWDKILSAECFILTSRAEGMSNALVEAMCLGLPVISTRVAGATDLIKDGENGYLIDVQDQNALVDRMRRIADSFDLRTKMGNDAVKVYDIFREEIVCKEWGDYLKSIIDK